MIHFLVIAVLAMIFLGAARVVAQNTCADSVQRRIAWAGPKDTIWTPANLATLCKGAQDSTAPGQCFRRVMGGTIDFGGGTQWNPSNALRLCAGANDESVRIACFEGKIRQGTAWGAAIDQCVSAAVAGINPGTLSTRSDTIEPAGSCPETTAQDTTCCHARKLLTNGRLRWRWRVVGSRRL
ncbi:MAG: hypothetical protein IPH50_03825 [Rhodanobacteraceae bacterium]|nr:hypothetical protein [Rhodanobacteraceae bacterium]